MSGPPGLAASIAERTNLHLAYQLIGGSSALFSAVVSWHVPLRIYAALHVICFGEAPELQSRDIAWHVGSTTPGGARTSALK